MFSHASPNTALQWLAGTEAPTYQEVGPYTFKVSEARTNMGYTSDWSSVNYTYYQFQEFDPGNSCSSCTMADRVIGVNRYLGGVDFLGEFSVEWRAVFVGTCQGTGLFSFRSPGVIVKPFCLEGACIKCCGTLFMPFLPSWGGSHSDASAPPPPKKKNKKSCGRAGDTPLLMGVHPETGAVAPCLDLGPWLDPGQKKVVKLYHAAAHPTR